MKKTTYTLLGLAALMPLAQAQDKPAENAIPAAKIEAATPAPSPEEVKEVFSYLLGYQFGQQLAIDANSLEASDFDQNVFFKGVQGGLINRVDPDMEKKDVQACMGAFIKTLEKRAQAQAEANLAAGKAFLAENAKKPGVTTTESGLQYKILTAADGEKYDEAKHGKNAKASITYEGRLINGSVFDAADTPIDMPINQVVPGFSEALKLMPVGSEWEIYIPAELGYGAQGPGVIGNNATLIFKLKLEGIQPGRGTQDNPIELTPELLQQLQESGLEPLPAGN